LKRLGRKTISQYLFRAAIDAGATLHTVVGEVEAILNNCQHIDAHRAIPGALSTRTIPPTTTVPTTIIAQTLTIRIRNQFTILRSIGLSFYGFRDKLAPGTRAYPTAEGAPKQET
jgi:hypothetical protein